MKQFPIDVYGVDRVDVLHEDKLHVNLNMDGWKRRYIYSPVKWLLDRLNIAWQWNEVKYETPLTSLDKVKYQIEYLTNKNVVPAYILCGPKQYTEMEAELIRKHVVYDLRPYDVGVDYSKIEIPLGKQAVYPKAKKDLASKAEAARHIIEKLGWADHIDLMDVDYGQGIKVQAMAVFGLHVFRVAWLDGVLVMPNIRGLGP